MSDPNDPYARLNYRRLIAWPARLEREAPFLRTLYAAAPSRRLVDLGCGTGEHARFLATEGYAVTGIDASAEQIALAREEHTVPALELEFQRGDIEALDTLLSGPYGGALCLGNALPHLRSTDALAAMLRGLAAHLLPGAPFLIQLLNYERIRSGNQRHLPLNLRSAPPGEDGEIVFLRLMDSRPDGSVVFNPCTLCWRPGHEPPLTVVSARNVELHGWTLAELEPALAEAGFGVHTLQGGMADELWNPRESADLVIVAVRLG